MLRIFYKNENKNDGIRYLVLFGSENYDAIYNRVRYQINKESGITYVYSHIYARIRKNIENANVTIFIK